MRPSARRPTCCSRHLSLLFVPVGVGVMTHLGLITQYGVRMLVVIVLSTWIGMAVTALVLRAMLRASAPETMQSFVELWVYLSATPLFGLTATLVTYVLAQALYERVRPRALGQPGAVDGAARWPCC